MEVATIRIYKSIGPLPNDYEAVTDTDFRYLLDEVERSGAKKALVRINSGGGNWLSGLSIHSYIKNSAITINTHTDGLAASSASMLFMAGKKRTMSAHAKIMVHNCSGGVAGQVKDLEKEIQSQKNINDSMARIYADATGKTAEYWAEKMEAETWFSAEEALAEGLCHEIVDKDKKSLAPAENMAVAELQTYYANLIPNTETNQSNNMKHIVSTLTGLGVAVAASASEEQVAEVVRTAFTDRDSYKTKYETAQTELESFKTAQSKTIIDGLINEGRANADARPHLEAMAKADFANFTAFVGTLPARAKLPEVGSGITADSRKDWNFEKWSQEDPNGLLNMKRTQPEAYTALLNKHIG